MIGLFRFIIVAKHLIDYGSSLRDHAPECLYLNFAYISIKDSLVEFYQYSFSISS